MPYTKRTDGKYNRQAQYFLISVKERNMDEFLDTLKYEKGDMLNLKLTELFLQVDIKMNTMMMPMDLQKCFMT